MANTSRLRHREGTPITAPVELELVVGGSSIEMTRDVGGEPGW